MYYIKFKENTSTSGHYLFIYVDSVGANGFNNYEFLLKMDVWDATEFVREEDAETFIDYLSGNPDDYSIVEV